MAEAAFDVVGVGNAIVDVLARAEEAALSELDLEKGAMTLIDADRAEELYGRMGPGIEVSGGSAANTLAGIASLGGNGAYIGKVRDDTLGTVFAHDLRATGITWMAVRGDEPLAIQQRAGHRSFNTTLRYINAAEVLEDGFGEPFPVLPATLTR